MAYILALVASVSHVAWTFNTLEQPGHEWAGWLAAIAVDCGLAALAYAIQQRKRVGRSVRSLWAGVIALAGISGYANALHALNFAPGSLFKAIVLSATLPLLVVYLGEIVSSDDAALVEQGERERRRKEAADERERTRLEREEAKRLQAQAELERQTSESFACQNCEFVGSSQNALNAHRRIHQNGHALEVATEAD